MTRGEKIAEAGRRVRSNNPNSSNITSRPLQVLQDNPCIFLGRETGEVKDCTSCGGKVSLKVLSCKIHGNCTIYKPQPDIACCTNCQQYQTVPLRVYGGFPPPTPPITYTTDSPIYEPIEKRHLIYHLLPVSGNGVWQKAISTLRSHWSLFTGSKIISIAQGGPIQERVDPAEKVPRGSRLLYLDSVATVKSLLPKDCSIIIVPNDPNLWEGISWLPLWNTLSSVAKPNDIVLYAHAKGVTRKLTSPCHPWTDMLYTLALDYIKHTENILTIKPICGSLPKWGSFFGGVLSNSRWHYAGNFWWARVQPVLDRIKSVPLPINKWAPEAWIGAAFHTQDAGVLFESRVVTHLYHPHELDHVLQDFAKWVNINLPSSLT